jgi:hypothetical protein
MFAELVIFLLCLLSTRLLMSYFPFTPTSSFYMILSPYRMLLLIMNCLDTLTYPTPNGEELEFSLIVLLSYFFPFKSCTTSLLSQPPRLLHSKDRVWIENLKLFFIYLFINHFSLSTTCWKPFLDLSKSFSTCLQGPME